MMVKIVDHLVQGLHIDIEKRKQENASRQKLETQLYKLLTELVETERKYVKDLEKVKFFVHVNYQQFGSTAKYFTNSHSG